jgi:O-antigen/teichoic acid export membrane protein
MLVGSLPPVLFIALLSPWVMSLYGPGFRDGWLLLILLVLAAPLHAMAKMASTGLLGMNRAWSLAWLNGLWGVTMLVTTSILAPQLGALGLAVAFLFAYLILMASTTALLFWYLHRTKRPVAVDDEPRAAS